MIIEVGGVEVVVAVAAIAIAVAIRYLLILEPHRKVDYGVVLPPVGPLIPAPPHAVDPPSWPDIGWRGYVVVWVSVDKECRDFLWEDYDFINGKLTFSINDYTELLFDLGRMRKKVSWTISSTKNIIDIYFYVEQ